MLACVPFALLWMLPPALKDFSQSLAAASTSTSNVLFWLRSGYFAPATELKPLIHTWSLGVEEQFYIAYPLFLAFAWRLGRGRLFAVVAALTLASLGAVPVGGAQRAGGELLSRTDPCVGTADRGALRPAPRRPLRAARQ